jgi:hypothetical protein
MLDIPALPNIRRLRGVLAARQISHADFARACGLNRTFTARILTGYQPGELARLKIAYGIHSLGLDEEVRHGRIA